MKTNTRNILLLVAVIVIAVVFLMSRSEGFFDKKGFGLWYAPTFDWGLRGYKGDNPQPGFVGLCPAGLKTYAYLNTATGRDANLNTYLCKLHIDFDIYNILL
jgi:hypothetical protein